MLAARTAIAIGIVNWIARLAAAADAAGPTEPFRPTAGPDGWTSFSPRAEIAPRFSVEGSGPEAALVIDGGGDPAEDGRWIRKLPVEPGKHYRFRVTCTVRGVAEVDRSALARVVWLDADGRQVAEAEYPPPASHGAGGGAIESVHRAPDAARAVRVELHLRWAPGGRARWTGFSFAGCPPPAPRKARLASINHRPRGSKSPRENLEAFARLVAEAAGKKADFACLPEGATVCGTGRSYVESAEPVPGPSTDFLGLLARRHRLYIVAGLYEREGRAVHNTAVLLDREGRLAGKYRKVCLPREEIDGGITPGDSSPVFDTDLGRVGIMICWDLSYPEVARALARKGAEVIFLPIWGGNETLARARAIENQVYIVASGYDFRTAIYDRTGKEMAASAADPEVIVAEVDLAERTFWPWLGDWRSRIWREAPAEGAVR